MEPNSSSIRRWCQNVLKVLHKPSRVFCSPGPTQEESKFDLCVIKSFIQACLNISDEEDVLIFLLMDARAKELFAAFLLTDIAKGLIATFLTLYDLSSRFSSDILTDVALFSSLLIKTIIDENTATQEKIRVIFADPKNDVLFRLVSFLMARFLRSSHFSLWCEVTMNESSELIARFHDIESTIPTLLSASFKNQPSSVEISAAEAVVTCGPRSKSNIPCIFATVNDVRKNSEDLISSMLEKSAAGRNQLSKCSIINEGDYYLGSTPVAISQPVGNPDNKTCEEEALLSMDPPDSALVMKSSRWLFPFLATVENLPHAVMVARAVTHKKRSTLSFPIIYTNKCFEQLTSHKREDVLGVDYVNLLMSEISQESASFYLSIIDHVPNTHYIHEAYLRLRRGNHGTFDSLVSSKPVSDVHGKLQYVIVFLYKGTLKQVIQSQASMKHILNALPRYL